MSEVETEKRILGAEAAIQKGGFEPRMTPTEWLERFERVRGELSEKQAPIFAGHERWMKERQSQTRETSAA